MFKTMCFLQEISTNLHQNLVQETYTYTTSLVSGASIMDLIEMSHITQSCWCHILVNAKYALTTMTTNQVTRTLCRSMKQTNWFHISTQRDTNVTEVKVLHMSMAHIM